MLLVAGAALLLLAGVFEGWTGGPAVERTSARDARAGARAERLGPADAEDALPALVGRPPPDVPLGPGGCGIHGTVRDAKAGTPVSGVAVHVLGVDDAESLTRLASAVSGPDGTYALRDLTTQPRPVVVLALGAGWVSERGLKLRLRPRLERRWRVGLRRGHWVEHDLRVARAGRIAGTVRRPDGTPAAGARVSPSTRFNGDHANKSHYHFPWCLVSDVPVDAQGRFEVAALPPAKGVIFYAALQGYRGCESKPVHVTPGETCVVDLQFDVLRDVRVQVLDAVTKTPIRLARVWIGDPSTGDLTGSTGRAFLFGVAPTPTTIHAEAAGYVPLETEGDAWQGRLTLDDKDEHWTTEIRLEPRAQVRGRVVIPKGVEFETTHIMVNALAVPEHPGLQRRAEADADGRFAVSVPPGRFVVWMKGQAGPCHYTAPEVEAEADGAEIELRPVVTWRRASRPEASNPPWRLTLLGPKGRPLSAATFHFEFSNGESREEETRPSDLKLVDGVVSFRVYRGQKRWLDVRAPRTASGGACGALRLGPFDTGGKEATFHLPAAGALSGRIVDPTGRPVVGAEVRARALPPLDLDEKYHWSGFLAAGVTDAQGRFTLDDLGVGEVDLHAWAWPDFALPALVRARVGATDVLLRLRPTMTARIRLLLPDGTPARGGQMHIYREERESGHGAEREHGWLNYFLPEADGAFRLEGLDPDAAYAVWIHAPPEPAGLLNQQLRHWRPQDAEIRLDRKRCLTGVVQDAVGEPQSDIRLQLTDATGKTHAEWGSWNGTFAFEGLPPGPVRVQAYFGSTTALRAGTPTVEAEAGDDGVVVVVESRRDLEVVFHAPGGEDFPSMQVFLTRATDVEGEGWSDSRSIRKGRVRFRGLEPGARYWLWAGPTDDGRIVYAEVPPRVETLEAHLVSGHVIRGRVALPAGAGDRRIRIDERGVSVIAPIGPQGSFALPGVPPGTWTLKAWWLADDMHHEASTTVPADGDREVRLEPTEPDAR